MPLPHASQIPVMGELLMTHRDANIAYDIWGKAGTGNPSSPLTSAHITPNDIEWYKWGLLEPGAATGQLNYYRALLLMESGLLKQDPEVRVCHVPCDTWQEGACVSRRRERSEWVNCMSRRTVRWCSTPWHDVAAVS